MHLHRSINVVPLRIDSTSCLMLGDDARRIVSADDLLLNLRRFPSHSSALQGIF